MRFFKILMTTVMLLALVMFCSCSSCSSCSEGGFGDGIRDLISSWFPCDHDNTEWRVIKSPTCDAEGTRANVCNVCGEAIESEPIAKTAHNWVTDKAVAPTCSKEGLTEGTHCENCNEVLVAQESIEKKPHTEVIDPAVEPTCSKVGYKEGSHCSVCKEVIVAQELVEKKPHKEVLRKGFDSTCTQTGLTDGKYCSVCGEDVVEQKVIEKKPHTEVIDAAVAATCTETGLTEGKHCSVCNEILIAQEIVDALGHKFPEGRAPTCTEYGFKINCCVVCGVCVGRVEVESIEPLGHDLSINLGEEASTCVKDGFKNWKCSRCDYTWQEIPVHESDMQLVEDECVPAKCGVDGKKVFKCTVCQETKTEIDPALEHDMKTEHLVATCCEPGKTVTHCVFCDYEDVSKTVFDADKSLNPDNHHAPLEIRITTRPDCVMKGQRLYYCKYCNYNKTEPIDALGHTWKPNGSQAPTCEVPGYTKVKCSVCEKEEITPALHVSTSTPEI